MKPKDLRTKRKNELFHLLAEKKTEATKLKMDLVTGKIKNVRKLREVKREIAQILTVLGEVKL